jgi:hypothetical protein
MDFEWLEDLLTISDGRKIYRERRNPLQSYSEEEFRERFHFRRQTAAEIINRVAHILEPESSHNNALSPDIQFLIALRFLSCSTFQGVCADLFNVHRTTVSRVTRRVVDAVNSLKSEYIKFPLDLNSVKQRFYSYGGMPGVIGCIDGTHIPLYRPSNNAEAEVYRCRKSFFSINTQVVSGPDHKIYDVVARWPGSTHDSRIFSNSRLKSRFENGELSGLLLGDSGYPCLK